MPAQDNQNKHEDIENEVIAANLAFGITQSSNYYIFFYLLTMLIPIYDYNHGLFQSNDWVMICQLVLLCVIAGVHLIELVTYFRVVAAFVGTDSLCEAVVVGEEGATSAEIIFEAYGLILSRGRPRFNSSIDKPLMHQFNPVDVIGCVRLQIENNELAVNHGNIDLIGFDHYRVTRYSKPHEDTPHILVRLKGGDRVYVLGALQGENGTVASERSKGLILIKASRLNAFLIVTSIRLVFLALAFCSLLAEFLMS